MREKDFSFAMAKLGTQGTRGSLTIIPSFRHRHRLFLDFGLIIKSAESFDKAGFVGRLVDPQWAI